MGKASLTDRLCFVLFFVVAARFAWALSDVFNLPEEDGCLGESVFVSEDNFGESGQRRTHREVIKPPQQQCLRYGMTEAEVQKTLAEDAYCSDYRAVSAHEARSILRAVEAYLPRFRDDNVRTVVYRVTQSKEGQAVSSPILIGCFHRQIGLLDAFWVRNGTPSPLIMAFGKGTFESALLSISVGEVLDSVFEKLGVRSPTAYEQDAVGVWCVRYVYDIANCPATIWVDGATATVRKVELAGAYWRIRTQHPSGESLDLCTVDEIVKYACSILGKKGDTPDGGTTSGEVETLLRISHSLRLQIIQCSEDEKLISLCRRRHRILRRLLEVLQKGAQESCMDTLQVALAEEQLKRFQCEYAQPLFMCFRGDTVDVAPYLAEHRRVAERCGRLARQAYYKGLIDIDRFYEILLLLGPPRSRLTPENVAKPRIGGA